LTGEEKILASSLARNSTHPLSREIIRYLKTEKYFPVSGFGEIPGKGISGTVNHHSVRMGNNPAIARQYSKATDASSVHLEIDGIYRGYFKIRQSWRNDLDVLFQQLSKNFNLHLLSGDNDSDRVKLAGIFPF